jgi:hypothetical protein
MAQLYRFYFIFRLCVIRFYFDLAAARERKLQQWLFFSIETVDFLIHPTSTK